MYIKKFIYDIGIFLYLGWGGGWFGVIVIDKILY